MNYSAKSDLRTVKHMLQHAQPMSHETYKVKYISLAKYCDVT